MTGGFEHSAAPLRGRPGPGDRTSVVGDWWPAERTLDLLLVLWLATLAADRIDLLAGGGPFLLTPFLALTPLVLGLEAFRLAECRGRIRVPSHTGWYALAVLAFLLTVLASVFMAPDGSRALFRGVHLAALIAGTLGVGVILLGRPDRGRILVAGAKLGLVLAVVFSVAQLAAALPGIGVSSEALGGVLNLELRLYSSFIPRLSGTASDANLGGLLYVFYLFVLVKWGEPGLRRRLWIGLGVALLLATLSRSAALAGGTVLVAAWIEGREPRLVAPTVIGALLAAGLFTGWMLVSPDARDTVVETLEPLSERVSVREGSAQAHIALQRRGIRVATASVERSLRGIGYGNAFTVLQDFFPGNKYGNFHSLYVTLLAESGIFALILGLVLLLVPVVLSGPFRPLVAGMVTGNLFYQTAAEPFFWLVLALAWLTLAVGRSLTAGSAPGGDGREDTAAISPGGGTRPPVSVTAQ